MEGHRKLIGSDETPDGVDAKAWALVGKERTLSPKGEMGFRALGLIANRSLFSVDNASVSKRCFGR